MAPVNGFEWILCVNLLCLSEWLLCSVFECFYLLFTNGAWEHGSYVLLTNATCMDGAGLATRPHTKSEVLQLVIYNSSG